MVSLLFAAIALVGFAVLLRFYTERGRFPRSRSEIPDAAVNYVARRVGVQRASWRSTTGPAARSSSTAARSARRRDSGSADADADKLTEWLVTNVTQSERGAERVRDELLACCREERIEPPTGGRVDRDHAFQIAHGGLGASPLLLTTLSDGGTGEISTSAPPQTLRGGSPLRARHLWRQI
jgi:hypothetical protein